MLQSTGENTDGSGLKKEAAILRAEGEKESIRLLLSTMGMFRELAGSPEDLVRKNLSKDALRGGMIGGSGND